MACWQLLVHETPLALYEEAARRFADAASRAVASRGRCFVALSGGATARAFYEMLAAPGWRAQVPWHAVHLFWGDERFVAADDPQSNYGMARSALLARIDIPPGHIHPMPTDAGTPEAAAMLYESTLRRVVPAREGSLPVFDLVHLGMGEDGHTASLFPGLPVLRVTDRLVAAPFVEALGLFRITMTVPVFNAAQLQMFLVTGASKAGVLREVLDDAGDSDRLPARLMQPANGTQLWLVDRAAAAQSHGS